MAEIGIINKLFVKEMQNFGVYLDGGELGDIILLKKFVPEECQKGDEVEVFVFVDGDGILQATTEIPFATVGQFSRLKVVASSSSGAFLDWGLQKDLFVPIKEQQYEMEEGKFYVVYIFLDKKNDRMVASSKLDKFLDLELPDYKEGEKVGLFVCDQTDLGYKVIVNVSHWGMIYHNELFQKVHVGEKLQGFVKYVREDLRIDITLQAAGYEKVDHISQNILKAIQDQNGSIAITDKSPPEEIYTRFKISKKTFKKAIGTLYKKRMITLEKDGIKLVKK